AVPGCAASWRAGAGGADARRGLGGRLARGGGFRLLLRRRRKHEDGVDRQHDVGKRSRSDDTTAADPLDLAVVARCRATINLDDLTGQIDDPDLRNSGRAVERKLHRPIVALEHTAAL